MKVPLKVSTSSDKLVIHRNKTRELVNLPFKPFAMCEASRFPEFKFNTIELTKVPEDKKTKYFKREFENIKQQNEFKARFSDRSKYFLSNIYLEQLFISKPDFLFQYPNDSDLTMLFWDIETGSRGDGLFPKPINNPILDIGYSIWNYKTDGKKIKEIQGRCGGFDTKTENDKKVCLNFLEIIQKYDPDILIGYNSDEFDLPYFIDRCKMNKISIIPLGRSKDIEPKIESDKIFIPGRVNFDLLNSNSGVKKDQTLYGIKDRQLKTIARWYNIDIADVDLTQKEKENMLKLYKENKERHDSYLDDDIRRTEHVGNIYLRNCITLAELLGVPLNNIINMYSSFVPKMFIARNFEKEGLINTLTNFQRYNINNGTIAQLGNKYQGAIVGLYKDKFFNNTWKLDFSSQYPSSIQTFNLGPDTTQLIEVRPYTGKFTCEVKGNWTWYNIPTSFEDEKYFYNLVIRIKRNKEGFLKREIKRLRIERSKIKTEMKEAAKLNQIDKIAALNSQQVAIKIILNSVYGTLGLRSSVYGDMISATMVTAMCRWCILKCMQRNKDCLIETDSVTGDTPVYVRNKNTTEIDIIPIEDLHVSNNKRQKYNGNYEILTRNRWKNIKYTKKHLVSKNIHRVKISDGYVDVTEDHSLFDADSEKEITPKDIIINKSRIETAQRPTNKFTRLSYGDLIESKEFCWLIGFFIAEGSATESKNKNGINKRQVSFNGNDKELMLKVENLANEYLSYMAIDTREIKTPSKFKLHNTMDSSNVYKVQGGYNKLIVDWFKMFCYTGNRIDKKVPIFILNGTQKMKESFLEGLMCGDGYKAINNGRKVEAIDSKFKSLAAGVRYLWNDLYYETLCSVREDKTNITTYKKTQRYSNGTLRKIDRNIVTINNDKLTNDYVCDVSTEDGTFITALGDIVLHNTDGLIVDKELDTNKENKWLEEQLKKKFDIDENYMELELEGNGERAFFYAMKNYVVENKSGDYTIHGSSFKSSKSSKIIDRAINLAINHWFNNKPIEEVISEAYSFTDLTLDDFVERTRLSKEQIEYEDKTDHRVYLAKQVELKTGQVVTKGTQIDYVVTKDPLPYNEFKKYQKGGKNYTYTGYVNSLDELNLNHYIELIDKALAKFGIEKCVQLSLFNPNENQYNLSRPKPLDTVPSEEI